MKHLVQLRWPNGFQCPKYGHDQGYYTEHRERYECAACHKQSSVTSGTLGILFHSTKLPLVKLFWAIYWVASDKGSISALRLSKLIGTTWSTSYRLLGKLRGAMGHRDTLYRLSEIIELDDAFIGGKRSGKRGRGAEGKTSVLIACENREGKPSFAAMEAVESVNAETVKDFAERRLKYQQIVCTGNFIYMSPILASVRHRCNRFYETVTKVLIPPDPRSLAIGDNRCARSTRESFMVEKGKGNRLTEQDCLSYRFQVIITKSPPTGVESDMPGA